MLWDQITVNDLSVDASFVFPTSACNTDQPNTNFYYRSWWYVQIDNGGTINAANGELDLTGTNGTETFIITYTVDNGTCNDAQAFQTISLTTCACSVSTASNDPTAYGATDGTLVITVSTADADYNVSIDGAPATQYTTTGTTITIRYAGGDVVTSVDVKVLQDVLIQITQGGVLLHQVHQQ